MSTNIPKKPLKIEQIPTLYEPLYLYFIRFMIIKYLVTIFLI